jgi:hypothetical protein
MAEHHEITADAKGAARAAGCVGASVFIPLDAAPSKQWTRAMTVHLASELTGHPGVGHLRLNDVVQGSDIVLEGVEPSEAELLGPVLKRAIDAANRVCASDGDGVADHPNMSQEEADRLARSVGSGARAAS